MGSGKGSPEYWVAVIKPGRIIYEVSGVSQDQAQEALRRAAMKMPIKCKFVTKPEVGIGESVEDELAS
jgi:large subunit ribosomal protein L16